MLKTPGGSQEVEKRQELPTSQFPGRHLRHFAPISIAAPPVHIRKMLGQPFFLLIGNRKKLHS